MAVTRINLALQGGGAHGAFTWGVLDRLLQDEAIEIAGISGTSAGALNGAALKAGLLEGGPDGGRAAARDNLEWLWRQIAAMGDLHLGAWLGAMIPGMGGLAASIESLMPMTPGELAERFLSPYALGSAYRNPLERIVRRFRFDRVCAQDGPRLFISATNVRSGKIRVFEGAEISTEAILASACLPTLFQAVDLDDPATGRREAFWDGGYTGNPALFPLFEPGLPDDVVIVNINPLWRDEVPISPQDIQNRINEISFNASLLRELRAIGFMEEMIARGQVQRDAMKPVLVHMIADDALMNTLSVRSKSTAPPLLLHQLREAGRKAADDFLWHHRRSLGVSGTVDLDRLCN